MDYNIALQMTKLASGFTPAQRVRMLEAGKLFRIQA